MMSRKRFASNLPVERSTGLKHLRDLPCILERKMCTCRVPFVFSLDVCLSPALLETLRPRELDSVETPMSLSVTLKSGHSRLNRISTIL